MMLSQIDVGGKKVCRWEACPGREGSSFNCRGRSRANGRENRITLADTRL